jgi:hypothetical protein
MEINLKKLSDQAIEGTTGSNKMRLSEDSASMVFQMFTKSIYSNPIGTVVREITSNCFDSHIEAKVNSPVIIRKNIDKDTGNLSISFIDFGVGMSPDRVNNIYGVYFASTKRVDNTQIGGFGIGGKTPLAYKRSTGHGQGEYDNSFNLITNHDGMKYFYLIYEGPESPVISLLHSEPTTDRNGTEVRIPVLPNDVSKFENEMVRQLYYFENVIFDGFDKESLTNNYQIIRAKSFLFRGNEYSSYAHVCLGRVAYPIDYSVLGLSSGDYSFPIALRLEIGDINVTANREALDYSENTIKVLKKQLEAAKKEITERLVKQYDNIVTLEDYFKAKNKFGTLFFENGKTINCKDIIKMKDVDFSNFKFSFTKMPDDVQLFNFFFNVRLVGKKFGKYNRRYGSSSGQFKGGYDELLGAKNLYFHEGLFERKIVKQAWLKTKHERYYVISRKNLLGNNVQTMVDVAELFNVHDTISAVDANGNVQPTKYMQSLLEMQDEYFGLVEDNCIDYNSLEVPADFIESRRVEKLSTEIRNTTIPAKVMGSYRTRIKLDTMFKLNIPIFYGTKEDEAKLETGYTVYRMLFGDALTVRSYDEYRHEFKLNDKKGVVFILIAQNNIKYMEYCKNANHISTLYWKMLHRKAKKVMNYYQAQSLVTKFNEINSLYRASEFKNICPTWAKKIQTLNILMTGYAKSPFEYNGGSNSKYYCSLYFPVNNVELTGEQQKMNVLIDEVKEMEVLNAEVMQHIQHPSYFSLAKPSYWNLLRSIMVY